MDDIEFLSRLLAIDPRNDVQVSALAAQVEAEARRHTAVGVQTWSTSVGEGHERAAVVLSALEDLAITALAALPAQRLPDDEVWLLDTIAEGELALRGKIATRVTKALDDRRPVPLPAPTRPVEERPPPRRVCDEAYSRARRLLHASETREAYYLNADAFLQLSEAERDGEIAKFRQHQVWSEWAEGIE